MDLRRSAHRQGAGRDRSAPRILVWPELPLNKHFWSFYHYCRRRGDGLKLTRFGDGWGRLEVTIRDG